MKRSALALLIAVLAVSFLETGVGSAQDVGKKASLTASGLAADNTAFGLSLFRKLYSAQPQNNVLVSPVSASFALEMAYGGARGSTAQGMSSALHLPGQGNGVPGAAHALLTSLNSSGGSVGVTVANSLWASSQTKFVSAFLHQAQTAYSARVQTLDFTSASAPSTINAWVNQSTQGKIPTIVTTIPRDVILYLINAVYFHGQWTNPFPSNATQSHAFSRSNGSTSQVQMMTRSGGFLYYHGSNVDVVELPYKGGRYSMSVVLPAPGVSLSSVISALTPAELKGWNSSTSSQSGSVSLPRFSFSNSFQLAKPLSSLGMSTAFSNSADFSGMCTTPCRLSQALQKTFINVDESGTTAAAVTAVGVSPTAVQQSTFKMVVDRPFLVSINDSTTGSTLFVGAVNSPS